MFLKFVILAAFASCVFAQTVLNIHGGNNDEDVPEGPSTQLSYGMFKIISSCNALDRPALRCGRRSTTKSACRRHNCCWNLANRNLNLPVCFQPKLRIMNYEIGKGWGTWGSWGLCLGKELCVSGKQFRFRKCDGVPGSGSCDGSYKESRDCITNGCGVVVPTPSTTAWGPWSPYSTCTVPSEPTCFTGLKSRTRYCMTGTVVTTTNLCPGSDSETTACDSTLCETSGSWVTGSCTVTCGGGSVTSTRTCLTGASGGPSSCWSKSETCNSEPCPSANSDPDLDIVMIMDGSEITDSCKQKEIDLNINAPFTGAELTSTNFPNFFLQKNFIKDFLTQWSTVTSSTTRTSVLTNSGQCTYATTTNFNFANYLSQTLTSTIVDGISFPCGIHDLFGTMICANNGLFISANGERSGNKNVGVFMIPKVSLIPDSTTLFNDAILSAFKASLGNINTILIMSTHDINSMSTADQTDEISKLNQLGCFTTNPVGCVAYIGNVYESTATVLTRMRGLV